MPCFTIKEISFALQAANWQLLMQALQAAKYTILEQNEAGRVAIARNARHTISIDGDKIAVVGQWLGNKEAEEAATKIKTSYAEEVVKYATKRYGFTRVQDKNNAAKSTLKRRF